MKNNKGYTLVELVVAMAIFAIIMAEVCNMMRQSSKLYLNGTYEIDLQTEAQQIVQQMEELLIDASVSINVTPNATGLSVNDINIDNTYYIQYLQPDPTVSYGNIYLTSTGSYTADHELMGEYVESLSLNMAEYETASKVTLEIALRNDQYTYSTSKDIYLRNDIGLGGGRTSGQTGTFQEELDVLRFREYNLSSMYNHVIGNKPGYEYKPNYIYKFQDGSTSNAEFVIRKSGDTYYVKASDTLNNAHNRPSSEYMIDVFDPDSGARVLTIKISTKEVKVGANGFGLFYGYDTNLTVTSPVHVDGLWLQGATSVKWSLVMVDHGNIVTIDSSNEIPSDAQYAFGENGTRSYDFTEGTVRMDSLKGSIRDDWNSIYFEGANLYGRDNYYNVLFNDGMYKATTTFTFPTGPSLTVTSYLYPMDRNNAMPNEVADRFWSNCN